MSVGEFQGMIREMKTEMNMVGRAYRGHPDNPAVLGLYAELVTLF